MELTDITTLEELKEWISENVTTPKAPPLRGSELNFLLNKMIEFYPDVVNDNLITSITTLSSSRILESLLGIANTDPNKAQFNKPAKGMVSFVIDSVANGIIDEVLPAFTSRGLKAAVAITVSDIRRSAHGDPGATYGWDGVQKVYEAGWEVGVRSNNGAILNSAMSLEEGEEQMKTAKQVIQSFGLQANFFIAPTTNYDVKFDPIVKKYYAFGYTQGATTGVNVTNKITTNPFRLNRVSTEGATTLAQAKALVDQAESECSNICFYFHDTDPSTVFANTKPISFYNDLLDYILGKNVDTVTPSESVSRLLPVLTSKTAVRQNTEAAISNPYLTSGKNYCINPSLHGNGLGWTLDKSAVTSGSGGTVLGSINFNDARLTYTGLYTITLNADVGINETVLLQQDIPMFTAIGVKQPVTYSATVAKLTGASNVAANKTFARIEFYNVGGTLISAKNGKVFQDTVGAYLSRISVTTSIPEGTTNIRVAVGVYKSVPGVQIGTQIMESKLEQSLSPSAYTENSSAINAGPFVKFNFGGDAIGDLFYNKDFGSVGFRAAPLAIGNEGDILKSISGVPAWVSPQVVGTLTNLPVYIKSNNITTAVIISSGWYLNFPLNGSSGTVGQLDINNAGGSIFSRDMADAIAAFRVRQINAGSTGNVFEAIVSGNNIAFSVNYLGEVKTRGANNTNAFLLLSPGTTLKAPLKWGTGGVLLTTPEQGAEETDAYGRYWTMPGFIVRKKYMMTPVAPNTSTAASVSKSDANTAYGSAAFGLLVPYPTLSGGPKAILKLDNSITGDWLDITTGALLI